MIEFMNLPFKENELEPFISEETIKFHYGKHHRAYVEKVNELIRGTEFDDMTLEDIILKTYEKPEFKVLYNNAGQVFNHNLYWHSMNKPPKLPNGILLKIINNPNIKDSQIKFMYYYNNNNKHNGEEI